MAKHCDWGCTSCHVHGVRAPWPANTPEPVTLCQHTYCTHADVADLEAPPCTEQYRLFRSPHAEHFHPKPTGRIALVEWGRVCRLEPPPPMTLF